MRFAIHVNRVEFLGGDRLLYGNIGGSLPETPVIARLPSGVPWTGTAGASAAFAVARANLRYFAAGTGKAIAPVESRSPVHA
jgi:multiple sugar transport system ATP-binding protein